MNLDTIKRYLTVFDLPSGCVLGIATLTMIGLMIAAFICKRPIDSSIQTVYAVILGAFALHKTSTAIASITTKTTESTDPS